MTKKQNRLIHEAGNYLVAILLPLFPLTLMLLISPDPNQLPLMPVLFFLPFIALMSWYIGLKPALITTLFSTLILYYVFTPPRFVIAIPSIEYTMQLFLFLSEGALLSVLIANGRASLTIQEYKHREKVTEQELFLLQNEMTRMKKEIKSRDEFLSIASHELKTPLTSMLLQTQTALHNIRNVSLARFSINDLLKMLESVENQTKRLSRMINDLLNVSLITTGNLQLEPEEVDVAKLVAGSIADFATRLKREGIELDYTVQESVTAYVDKLRIEQAVANLLSNAIKYGDKKQIIVKTEKKHSFVRISIKDHGIGISKENQKKIFGLFERGVTNGEYKGLGVGLFITNQIVKAHGGTILVSSKVGDGSEFIIELPTDKLRKAPTSVAVK